MILLSSQESGSDSDVSGSSACDTCHTPRIVLCDGAICQLGQQGGLLAE